MGGAIIEAVLPRTDIEVYAFDPGKVERLQTLSVNICESAGEVARKSDYIVLAVKPQVIADVLDEIAAEITCEKVLVSIAAGVSSKLIQSHTSPQVKIVLAMPNTPIILGEGAVALARNEFVSDDEFAAVTDFFASCAVTAELPEDKMNEVIAVSASSPAFIYLFAKGFFEYAESAGLDPKTAQSLFCAALRGSARMLEEYNGDTDTLIKAVTSPGGTTIAGLGKLYSNNLVDTVKAACAACTARAYELGNSK